MRRVLAIEGVVTNGTLIVPGALRIIEDRIPVTMGLNHDVLVGWASDMERDEKTGEVSVEVHLFEKYSEEDEEDLRKHYDASFSCSIGESEQGDPKKKTPMTLKDGELRSVFFHPMSAFPRVSLPPKEDST